MNDPKITSVSEETIVKKKTSGATIAMLVAITILLGTGIYLFADNHNKQNNIVELNTKVTESEARYTDLDSKYTATLAELESYRGRNAELDSLLTVQEKMVTDLQASLNKERKNRQLSEKDYKKHLDELAAMVTELNAQIANLQQQNSMLGLQKDSLNSLIEVKTRANTDLQTVNTQLSTKVTIASLLIPQDFAASGTYYKNSGKEVVTYKAGKANQLRICFTVPENKVAEKGNKTFYVRILAPGGKVLTDESKGSGVFTSVEKNEQREYSFSSTFDYDQTSKDLCMHWKQKTELTPGIYTAEIYQDGYLVSNQKFELK